MGDSRAGEMAAALGVLYALSVVFAALRVYVRVCISKNWGLDDTLLMATLAVFTVYAACSATGIRYGTGRHFADIKKDPSASIPNAMMYWFLCELWYTLATVLLRLSISIFLLRICVKRSHKYLIYATMAMVCVFSIFYFLLAIFQCQPTSFFWMQFAGAKGTCIDHTIFPNATYAHSAVSATADFVLGLLPICIIWDLKMNLQTKISVGVVLSMGVIAGLGTLIRIPYIRVLTLTDDFLYATVDVAIWSTVEPALGIIAAAACVLRPLFKNFYELSTHGGSAYGQTGSSAYGRSRKSYGGGRSNAMEKGLALSQPGNAKNGAKSTVTSQGHVTPTPQYINGQARDKKVVRILNKSISSSNNSSQEELTGVVGGIQVSKTVEVSRTERPAHGESRNSMDSIPPTPWPKP